MRSSLLISAFIASVSCVTTMDIAYAQWVPVTTGVSNPIYSIQFADSATVYATGDSVLIKSLDGGHNWTNIAHTITLTDPSFQGVYFINKDTGFVYRANITGNPTMLKTINGGMSWTDVSSAYMSQGVNAMYFVNDQEGYATGGVGAGNAFCKTVDGGNNWVPLQTPSNVAASSLYFINNITGFSGDGILAKTVTGGTSWNNTTGFTTGEKVIDYHFFDAAKGLAITENWNLYKTTNGGNDWSQISTPYSFGVMCFGMAFLNQRNGYAVGLARLYPLVTADGGDTWNIDNTFPAEHKGLCISAWGNNVIVGTLGGKVVLNNRPVHIKDITNNTGQFVVYPNPANNSVSVYSSTDETIKSLKILTVHGQEVNSATSCDSNRVQADISSLPNGFYIMQITGDTSMHYIRLSVQH